MCGRFTLTVETARIAERFDCDPAVGADIGPRFNIAPTQAVPMIINDESGNRLITAQWGLIPSWAKDRTIGARLINARAETVDEKPAFRSSFIHRRCLIPADGFYEWQKVAKGKQPYRITLAGGELFAFAGLWEQWRNPSGGLVFSCAIITCAANKLVGTIHQRMPVILAGQVEQAWLNRELKDRLVLKEWLVPYPPEAMTAYQVSPLVNSPHYDDSRLILPLDGGSTEYPGF